MASNNGPSSLDPNDAKANSSEDLDDGGSRQNVKGASKGMSEKERKIGHRRVNEEGEVSYKKIQTNQLMASIQLGIQYSISSLTKFEERDLLMQDFMTVESTYFPRNGSQQTPAHPHSEYTFRTYAPVAFRYFHKLFGIQREDFLMSICNEAMRELCNPGASGSIFYLTNDDEFILKTVQHKEAEFLQKLLPGYFMNLNQNPHTLLPKFFGMFCYHCNQKNIRLTIMNNILPSSIKMHLKFDLKGSTYKRKANKRERAKGSPTFKDLDFMELLPEGVLLEQETYNALISTLRRDCRVLESFRIMDYSLLIGIHNLDLAAKEEMDKTLSGSLTEEEKEIRRQRIARMRQKMTQKHKLVAHSTAMESIQAQTDPIDGEDNLPPGGIPARNHKGERLLLYLGIIDILQSYRIRKKLEHTLKSIIQDADTVSVHRPGFYAHRFLDFCADRVFKKIPSPLKHSPSKKGKRDSIKKRTSSEKDSADPLSPAPANGQGSYNANPRPDVVPGRVEDEGDYVGGPDNNHVTAAGAAKGSNSAAKPKHKQYQQVKKMSNADTRSMSELGSGDQQHSHGTPSHLSVGGSSGWNTPTPTWTEGTPSFTESTKSGLDLAGGLGVTSTRSGRVASTSTTTTSQAITSSQRVTTTSNRPGSAERRLPTCSFTETEM